VVKSFPIDFQDGVQDRSGDEALVSTSANLHGRPPAVDIETLIAAA
jgi:hypothetical protein